MSEVKDESDLDMLFDESLELSDDHDAINPVDPQLSRLNQHSGVITQIEAVFETVADALLNERADVTISLTSPSSNEPRDTSVRTPKAVFIFPGKTANDAWRFCR
jgi:meiotic recombination protein SPO11